jgi:porin
LFNVDLKLSLDLNEIFGWTDATIEVYGLGNGGTRPSDRYLVAQPVSSIETNPDWRLYAANLQFTVADGDLSFLIGLYDLNSEFCTLASAAPFVNSAFGIGPEIAQTGEAGPSIFPVTSLGIRTIFAPFESWVVSLALLDGVPGNPNSSTGTYVVFNGGDGYLIAGEIAYAEETKDIPVPFKIGVGGWMYTSPFEDLAEVCDAGSPIWRRGNSGVYGLIEGPVERHLSGFIRVGTANAHLNRFDLSVAGGINLHDIFRVGDLAGIALSIAHNGWEYCSIADPLTVASETVIELTYLTNITPWLAIQPDMQVFANPDGNSTRSALVAGGARFLLSF